MTFGKQAFLVGPNNAGKSTVIAALRTGAGVLRLARSRSANERDMQDGIARYGHLVTGPRVGLVEENLRHEFHPGETKLVFHFSKDARLEITWAEDPDELPAAFCTFQHRGSNLRRPLQVRAAFPSIGVVPVLTPVDLSEVALSDDHLRASVETRLASRHTRNHLYQLTLQDSETHRNGFEEFKAFAQPWISELELGRLDHHMTDEGTSLDLYYSESGGRHPKEIFWAGDGMQIWVQLLLHLFRLREAEVIVLDEPDLFLHADMQRRLVSLLEQTKTQVITATHSPEVLAEARQDSVVWIARNRRRGIRAPKPELLSSLSSALGTQFNLRLARALRAKAVVFVEGDDTRILRNLGRTLGARALSDERRLVTIPLRGFDRWHGVEPFSWMLSEFLEGSVAAWVILDRDYRTDESVAEVEKRLKAAGAHPHIWERHELENYLLCAPAIERISGASTAAVETALKKAVEAQADEVRAGLTREAARGTDVGKASVTAQKRIKGLWRGEGKLTISPGKEVLSALNRSLQKNKHTAVSARALSQEMTDEEIPKEMRLLLRAIEDSATSP